MSAALRLAIAQINCTVGDFTGNARRIAAAAAAAAAGGAHILLTPELSLWGYPPEDLLLRPACYRAAAAALAALTRDLAPLTELRVLVGHALLRAGQRFNAVSILHRGVVLGTYCKRDLPNYGVFDEQRYFCSAEQPCVLDVGGTRCAINICEDAWFDHAPRAARAAGAQLLLLANASPFHRQKPQQRLAALRAHVSGQGLALAYANLVGGQDELVFDGASLVLDAQGRLAAMAAQFAEELLFVDFRDGVPLAGAVAEPASDPAQAYAALKLGVRDYLAKNGFASAIVGLSGGVDSALTLAVAGDALGPERVRAVMMPSQYTAQISLLDARELAGRLGVRYDELPITAPYTALLSTLQPQFAGRAWDSTEENLQARTRGTLLMALANKTGAIVLTTGNKSELALGYCTLYGDMAGGLAVIKDVTKSWVYRLARYRNALAPLIPERILLRAPSAELRANQTDQDTLPSYDLIDAVIEHCVEQDASVADLVAAGWPEAQVRRVLGLIRISEHKRRQAPVGIRLTRRAFGRDWRYPITNRFVVEGASAAAE